MIVCRVSYVRSQTLHCETNERVGLLTTVKSMTKLKQMKI